MGGAHSEKPHKPLIYRSGFLLFFKRSLDPMPQSGGLQIGDKSRLLGTEARCCCVLVGDDEMCEFVGDSQQNRLLPGLHFKLSPQRPKRAKTGHTVFKLGLVAKDAVARGLAIDALCGGLERKELHPAIEVQRIGLISLCATLLSVVFGRA